MQNTSHSALNIAPETAAPDSGPDSGPKSGSMSRDYARVVSATEFILHNWSRQPSLAEMAAHVGLSPGRFQRLFLRWAGITPKAFVQTLTLDHARHLLRKSATVLDAALETGLSGPGRLHDLFVTHEAMTPGAFKAQGAGIAMRWGIHDSPFGACLLMITGRGLAGLAFADDEATAANHTLLEMSARWPQARFVHAPGETAPWAERIFSPRDGAPLHLMLIGTDFQIRVWRALLAVPRGVAVSYGDLARRAGDSGSARAVGTAVGSNPVAYVVPCHRVLRNDGKLGGYHWGLTRKRALIGFETAHRAPAGG